MPATKKSLPADNVVDSPSCTILGWPMSKDRCDTCDVRKEWEEESQRYARVHGNLQADATSLEQKVSSLESENAELRERLARAERSASERLDIILSSLCREVIRPLRVKEIE